MSSHYSKIDVKDIQKMTRELENEFEANKKIREFKEALDDGTVPEDVLTVGRLIKQLLNFKISTPVKVHMCGRKEDLKIASIGVSPNDDDAWFCDGIENPHEANVFEILVDA